MGRAAYTYEKIESACCKHVYWAVLGVIRSAHLQCPACGEFNYARVITKPGERAHVGVDYKKGEKPDGP
jgi:hypothetical protein